MPQLKGKPVNLWVGITDYDWFSLHASKESVEEVNFWRPSRVHRAFDTVTSGKQFSDEQQRWLDRIRDHLIPCHRFGSQ